MSRWGKGGGGMVEVGSDSDVIFLTLHYYFPEIAKNLGVNKREITEQEIFDRLILPVANEVDLYFSIPHIFYFILFYSFFLN